MAGYIGNIPVPESTQQRYNFVATASQTTFTTGGYTIGYVDVFLNGVKLDGTDFTATSGTDIVLAIGAAAGDILEVISYSAFQVADTGAKNDVFWENATTVGTDYTITSGKNAGSFGPITVNTGVTVTVPSGSVWTIV